MTRGRLRIYLGAAPGVGKTFAMLDEGHRRAERGTDVVIGVVETHGRARTIAQLRSLEIVPRRRVEHRGATFEEMDLEAILARRPSVCLVDELAHTNAPGGRHEKRWQDIDTILDAGIDVISTVNIQHLESVHDVVANITGIAQNETVPDAFVRSADQIELVDMSPEALRRRLAHGNVYPAERVDAALQNYFRPGNLAALRELALLWVADRVEASLQQYLHDHGVAGTWETRERVVVALTGAPSGDALIRRAARIAGRVSGDLVGVRVARGDGLADGGAEVSDQLRRQRELLTSLGGTYHEVVADDPATALVRFATERHATQLVLGSSRRSRWDEITRGSVISRVIRDAGAIDIHVIATPAPPTTNRGPRQRRRGLTRRRIAAWGIVVLGLPAVLLVLLPFRDDLSLSTHLLIVLGLVVAAAVVGGFLVALIAAVLASLAIDVLFIPPYGTFEISEPDNQVALVAFLLVGAIVGFLVDRGARRGDEALRARSEAEALARATAVLVGEPDPLPRLMDVLRSTFGFAAAGVVEERDGRWQVVAASGEPVPLDPSLASGSFPLPVGPDETHRLVVAGRAPSADDARLLRTFADQIAVALSAGRLAERARVADDLAATDAVRTAILQAVSHDLRTPLASIKAYVSGLRQPDVAWSDDDLDEALAAVDESCDRLDSVIGNLLDASRLQAGVLAVHVTATALSDVVARAVRSVPAGAVDVVVPEELPLVATDAALLERAIANVVTNALRHEPSGSRVLVQAEAIGTEVALRVVDHGPGIQPDQRDLVTRPFQRLGDAPDGDGIGLGLAITAGFVEAVGARLLLDDTPGGGLTVTMWLPLLSEPR